MKQQKQSEEYGWVEYVLIFVLLMVVVITLLAIMGPSALTLYDSTVLSVQNVFMNLSRLVAHP